MPRSRKQTINGQESLPALDRDFLVLIWQLDRQNKFEFYKQAMILSVAGLGFNLSPLSLAEKKSFWPIDSAWDISVSGFLLVVILTLLIFYLRSWRYSFLSDLLDPDIDHSEADEISVERLGIALTILTWVMIFFFTLAIIAAIISLP